MKDLYGTLIIFFYFLKYPLVIFLPIAYIYLNYENNYIMNILWIISLVLILKDWFYPHKEES
jgi:hypothetical protein